MSGATLLNVEREFYKLALGTPRIEFAPIVIPGVDRDTRAERESAQRSEQAFHENARIGFERYVVRVAPKLDLFMATLVQENPDAFPLARYTPQAVELTPYNRKELLEKDTHHCQTRLSALSSVPDVLGDVSVYLSFHSLPSEDMLDELEQRLREFLLDLETADASPAQP